MLNSIMKHYLCPDNTITMIMNNNVIITTINNNTITMIINNIGVINQ